MENCVSIVESGNGSGVSTVDAGRRYLASRMMSTERGYCPRVVYLSVFPHDVNRTIAVWEKYCADDVISKLQSMKVRQCVTLDEILGYVSGSSDEIIVIEDLDEAFNNAFFSNATLARSQIMELLLTLRRLTQENNVTCLLPYRRGRPYYHVQHIGVLVRNMVDNCVVVGDGYAFNITSIYDNIPQ